MKVNVRGKSVELQAQHLLGSGGEANVFSRNKQAFKIFHNPSSLKEKKVKRLMAAKLPSRVMAPKELVLGSAGDAVGYVMPLLPKTAEPLKMLANRNFRKNNGIDIPEIVRIYADLHNTLSELHRLGIVVGDLNDLNEVFVGEEVLFIDSDSFQVDGLVCEVATEDYLCPDLYDIDLTKDTLFTEESDWYSYATLLYRSLMLVHPYGGVYPGMRKLPDRAKARITALDTDVKYPKLGINPEVLSDDLLEQFEKIYKKGQYGLFPSSILDEFGDSIRACPSCGQSFWTKRKSCPACSKQVMMPVAVVDGSYRLKVLCTTKGTYLFSAVLGRTLYAVSEEGGKLHLTSWNGQKSEVELFDHAPGFVFGVGARRLLLAKKGSSKLAVLDPASGKVVAATETELYKNVPVFSGTERYVYRVMSGQLLRGELVGNELREKSLCGVLSNQTWIAADDQTGVERVFLAGRYFANWDFRLVVGEEIRDLQISSLDSDEKLLRATVRFGKRDVLLLRETKQKGKNYLRLDLVSDMGFKKESDKEGWTEDFDTYFEGAFSGGVLVHAKDEGISAVKPETKERWTYKDTESYVMGGEKFLTLRGKLLSVTDRKITLIEKS